MRYLTLPDQGCKIEMKMVASKIFMKYLSKFKINETKASPHQTIISSFWILILYLIMKELIIIIEICIYPSNQLYQYLISHHHLLSIIINAINMIVILIVKLKTNKNITIIIMIMIIIQIIYMNDCCTKNFIHLNLLTIKISWWR